MEASKFVSLAVLSVAFFLLSTLAEDRLQELDPLGLHKLWPIKFVECDYHKSKEPTCTDCHKRLICTPLGGLELPCLWPGRNNCVAGKCESKPSDHCKAEESTTSHKQDTSEGKKVETTRN